MDLGPLEPLINFGAIGVVLALLLTGQLAVKREVESLREDRNRYREIAEGVVESVSKMPEVQDSILETSKMILRVIEDTVKHIERR